MSTFDPEAFDRKYRESLSRPREGGQSTWKVKLGRSTIRILPPHPNMGGDPICEMRVHFGLGPASDTWAPCMEYFGEPCLACDWNTRINNQARAQVDPDAKRQYRDKAYQTRSQYRYGMNIVDLAHPEAGVQKYYVGSELEKRIRALFYSDDPNPVTGRHEVRNLTDPETGRDILIDGATARGKVSGQEYIEITAMRPKDTPSKLMDPAWVEQVFDLTEDRYRATPEQMKGALEGKRIEKGAAQTGGALVAPATVPLPPPLTARTPMVSLPPAQAPAPAPAPAPPAPPAPTPPAPPTPAPRGPGRPRNPVPAPAPAVVLPPAETPATVVQRTRQPLTAIPTSTAGPRAAARAMVLAVGVTPGPEKDVTEEEIAKFAKNVIPPCYKMDPEPKDPGCQGCRLLLSCLTHKYALDPA